MAVQTAGEIRLARQHRHDRSMVIGVVLTIWFAIISGFGIDMVKRAYNGQLGFPLVVHLHVLAYGSWLVLLGVQVWLVRTRRTALHRRLGPVALALIPAMLVLGPATALTQATNPYMPDRWIAWLSVELTNAFGSGTLLIAGYAARRHPAAHRHLMLLGTIAMTEPGFSRIWEAPLATWWGEGYLPFYFSTYIGTFLLVGALGAYNLVTRGRLHAAYVLGALWILANEAMATWLFYQPYWLATARVMTGHSAH